MKEIGAATKCQLKKGLTRRNNLVFIVGIPRSGTTWILSTLENHPDCLAITADMIGIAVDHPTKETGLFMRGFSDAEIVGKISRLPQDKFLVEKTPSHLMVVDRIRWLFPASKIILIRRNPVDVIYSMVQKNPFWKDSPPKTLADAVNLYLQFAKAEAAFRDYDYILEYESMWENPITEVDKLFKYLNLSTDFTSEIIEKTKYGHSLQTELKTIFRKGIPGQGLQNFTTEEMNFIRCKLRGKGLSDKEIIHAKKSPQRIYGGVFGSMKILLTNHHLLDFTGSEIFTFTIADFLKKRGHEVIVYSKYVDRMLPSFQSIKVPVVQDLALIKGEKFDIAHVHHNINAIEVRYHFRELPIVFLSHGILPFLEQPPYIDLNISKFLAVSEEVKQNLVKNGVKENDIKIYRNIVDSQKFCPINRIRSKPEKALILSNRIDANRGNVIREACNRLNIQCKFIGSRFGEIEQALLPHYINDADIVFSLGRGAIETMLHGRVPIIFDYFDGDGMVTPENIKEIMKCNFSGRRYRINYTVDGLVNEIEKYRSEYGNNLREIALEYFAAENQIDVLIGVYEQIIKKGVEGISELQSRLLDVFMHTIIETRNYAYENLTRQINQKQQATKRRLEEKSTQREVASQEIEARQSNMRIGLTSGFSNKENKFCSRSKLLSERKDTKRNLCVSIIIPLFNQFEYTKQCLEALIQNTPDDLYEVIIVDNGSTNGTKEFLACLEGDVKIITNEKNHGFAKACNQGAKVASGRYLAFLNNDTLPQKGWLEELVKVADGSEDIAIVGSKLLFPDGTIQHAGVAIAESRLGYHIYRGRPGDFSPANKPRDFQVVTAACMLIKKDVFFDVGSFDESYVNGCEDIDLCFKVRELGKRVFYCPRSVLTHFEGKTEGREDRMDHNRKLLLERWGNKVEPDHERFLVEDGFRLEERNGGKCWVYHEGFVQKKLSIVIVTYNSMGYIQQCLESIETQTLVPYEVIIIDNNSRDGTRVYLKKLKNAQVILNDENQGFSKATNQGIRIAKGEYIVILNPDTAVTWDWASHMIDHFKKGIAAVGPVSNQAAGLHRYDLYMEEQNLGAIDINKLGEKLYIRNKGKGILTKFLTGFCMMIKKEVIESVGMLDEDLFLGSEDLEYSWRLRNKRYRLVVATDTFIYHKAQASFASEPEEKMKRLTQESQDILYSKLEAYYGKGKVPPSKEIWGMGWFRPSQVTKDTLFTSIIILTFNQIEYTKRCLYSIEKYTSQRHKLILVDNGSTDGTVEFLKDFAKRHENVELILNEENLGFAKGNNQGVEKAKGEYILLLNNDVVVTEGWLGRMINYLESAHDIGMVGPMSNNVSGPQKVDKVSYGTNMKEMHRFARRFAKNNAGKIDYILRLVGFCLLIKKEVIDLVGGLDEDYGTGNFEDDDLCLRSYIAGYRHIMAHDVFVHHFGSKTFEGNKIDYNSTLEKNREYFASKWEGLVRLWERGDEKGYVIELKPGDRIKALIKLGEREYEGGNVKRAVKLFEEALMLDPRNSQALNNFGAIQWELGDATSAIKIFQKVLYLDSHDKDALFNLAQAVSKTGRFDLVEKTLVDAVRKAQPQTDELKAFYDAVAAR